MSPKKLEGKKNSGFSDISSLIQKKITKIKPSKIIGNTKNKLENYYSKLKKERDKEKIRLEKKRKLDEKRELINQKKQAQKEKLDKIKEEKRQILIQKK